MKWLVVIAVLVVAGGAVYTTACPCERVPGAWLFGEVVEERINDWTFVNDRTAIPLCQVQITTWRPHSINLNCMSDNGKLYISCSNCDGKRWSSNALTHPNGRIRADGRVYPVRFTRVTDSTTLDQAWSARLRKIDREPAPRPDHWWSFELQSRAASSPSES